MAEVADFSLISMDIARLATEGRDVDPATV